jgi:hypothetical protein
MIASMPRIIDGRAQIAPAKDRPKLPLLTAETPPTMATMPRAKRGTPTMISQNGTQGPSCPPPIAWPERDMCQPEQYANAYC